LVLLGLGQERLITELHPIQAVIVLEA